MRSFAVLSLSVFLLSHTAPAQDTVRVSAGWNIIGSMKSGAVPDLLATDPPGLIVSSYFGYVPGSGYAGTDTLEMGLGYWVKASADGIIVFSGGASAGECGARRVTHEGRTYHTVPVGGRCWLEENIDAGTFLDSGVPQSDNAVLEKHCYDNDTSNCALYGGLYTWGEASQYAGVAGARGICPTGWHLPTAAEFGALVSAVGNDANALKALGQGQGAGAGTNSSGFSALLAGFELTNTLFNSLGVSGMFWTSTALDGANAQYTTLDAGSADVGSFVESKQYGFSVRCIED